MVAVNIVKSFTFTHDRTTSPEESTMWGKEEFIPVGQHEFPDAMGNHWFVQAHSDQPPYAAPRAGTPEFGHAEAVRLRRRKLIEAAIEQEAADAALQVKQDALQSSRAATTEEQVHAEETAEAEKQAEQAAVNEAARTGQRAALPQRRSMT